MPLWSLTQDGCFSSKSVYKFLARQGIEQQFPQIPWKLRIPAKSRSSSDSYSGIDCSQTSIFKKGIGSVSLLVFSAPGLLTRMHIIYFYSSITLGGSRMTLSVNEAPPISTSHLPQLLHRMSQGSEFQSHQLAAACWYISNNQRIFQNK
jgi:hypothetical protein